MSSGPRAAGVATRARSLVHGLAVGLAAMLAIPAAAVAIDEFPVGPNPGGITAGPDGALWFVEEGTPTSIARITTAGVVTNRFSVPTTGTTLPPTDPNYVNALDQITLGPDGNLWFTEPGGNSIGRITTSGAITNHFPVPTPGAEPTGITVGPGGGLWFTESAVGQIAQISTSGTVTEYPGAGAAPSAIAGGADGALWFTQSLGNAIGRITTSGAIWFTEFAANKIGRIATATPVVVTPPPVKPLLRKKCKVPKVKGLTVKKAVKKLKRAKCKYKVRGKGRVTKTSPKAGKRTRKTVKVTAKPRRRR